MNSNARASVAANELIENSSGDDESNNESKEHDSGEIITDLDFFGAFSLVNIQLQWKDFFIDLNEEESDSDSSSNPKELFVNDVDVMSSATNDESLPTPSVLAKEIDLLSLTAYRSVDDLRKPISIQRKQGIQTIAYILNCGTYPKSC